MAKDISPKNPSKGKKGDKDKKDREEDRKTNRIKPPRVVVAPGGTVPPPSIPKIPGV